MNLICAEFIRSLWKELDLKLPKLSGFEVLKKVRADEETKEIPVIIVSVLEEQRDIQKGLELGADNYLPKSFYSLKGILNKIQRLLTEADIRKYVSTFKVSVNEEKADANKLAKEIGLTKVFYCPQCNKPMLLELIPFHTRPGEHWYKAHFMCPECNKTF